MKIILWPFTLVGKIVELILKATGKLIAFIIGLVFIIVGIFLTITIIGAIIGIPMTIIGFTLVIKGIF